VLSKCTNLRTLKIALNTLPSTLDETYSRVLRSIPDEQRDDVIRLLQLLVYSDEPLNLEEAVDAIAVSCTAKPYFDPEYRTPIHSEIIISCASLVMIERISEAPGSHVHREVLQITHFSVQQYLKSENVDPDWKDGLLEDHAMASNAKLCLAYCFELYRFGNDYDGLDGVDDDDKYLEDMPFTNTAARQWTQYAMQAKTHDSELYSMIQDFLTSDELEGARFNWLRLKDSEEHLVPDRKWSSEWFRESPEKLVPLTIASACGLYHSVESLLLCGTDPNEFCPIWGSALYAASYGGHHNVVMLLLEHGARPDTKSGRVELSVTISSPNSTKRSEISHALLQYDADINACDEVVGVPLILAAARGDGEIVNTLLARGADVNAVDNEKRNAIQVAAYNGYDTIVRKLLEHKADVNSSGGPNGNALISASLWGHKEVVRTLLQNGAVVCQQFDLNRFKNALEAACWGGDQEIFQMLIEHAVRVEHFNAGRSLNECLIMACIRGHDQIVRLLFNYQIDVNAQHYRFGSPLFIASESGHAQIVQLLVDHGADVNQIWKSTSHGSSAGPSPLHRACSGGHEEVTTILLDHHADINAQCGLYDTVLMAACHHQSEEFVEMLIKRGANVNQVCETYGTALIMTCVRRREFIVKTLLAHGADVNQAEANSTNITNSSIRRTPLLHVIEMASPFSDQPSEGQARFLSIIKTLIAAGADLNKPDDEGQTPLHYAAVSRSSELTEMLIEAGAHLKSVDESGQTPLIKAAEIKAKGRAEVLLKAGAKTDVQDIDGKTALHHAAEHGWLELCTMLVEAGANLGIMDNQGLTPLQLAEQEDQPEVVALLQNFARENSMG
jgi:ankyrin repeat protein